MKFFLYLLSMTLVGFISYNPTEIQLSGQLTDPDGKAVSQAAVTLFDDGRQVGSSRSDADGNFKLTAPAGLYDLEIEKDGFVTQVLHGVRLPLQNKSPLWIALTPGSAEERIVLLFKEQNFYRISKVSGKIVDKTTKEPLIGASVMVTKGRELMAGGITDVNGLYSINCLAGRYNLEVRYTGYPIARIENVEIKATGENILNFEIEADRGLQEVVVESTPKRKKQTPRSVSGADKAAESGKVAAAPAEKGRVLTAVEIRSLPTRKVSSISATTAETPLDEIHGATERRVIPYTEAPAETSKPGDPSDYKTNPAPAAGLLTAGEWNDLNNWKNHWTALQSDGELDAFQNTYKFFPKNRYTVLAANRDDVPMIDMPVQLINPAGNVIWEARTDNTGKAELWAALFENAPTETFRIQLNGQIMGTAKPADEGMNRFVLDQPCRQPKKLDIVWTVDATGSMGDEIEYLKTELYDVMARVKMKNRNLDVRMGAVFYRDETDDYLVKSSPLTADIARTVDFIKQQNAGGGGDFPEAVHSALEEAVYHQAWSEEAVARICFLVLDADAHERPEVIQSLQKTIREAARLGVRVVPVACSGIRKSTEFMLKFFDVATNGSYVFLTDDSGIGGDHLEPTSEEYKVEAFNNLLVRLISDYAAVETCDGKSVVRFEDPQSDPNAQNTPETPLQLTFYPNPVSDRLTLELPEGLESIAFFNSEGKLVRKLDKPGAGLQTLTVNDLNEGFYTLRFIVNGRIQTAKLMVVR